MTEPVSKTTGIADRVAEAFDANQDDLCDAGLWKPEPGVVCPVCGELYLCGKYEDDF